MKGGDDCRCRSGSEMGSRSLPRTEGGHKMELPIFVGEDAHGWRVHIDRYFRVNGIRDEEKMDLVNGFQPFFFKHYWDWLEIIFGVWLRRLFWMVLLTQKMLRLNVLIPKTENPIHMKSFRPIRLCNVVYNIITKVLVNRLRLSLDEIIGPLHDGFIPSPSTTNNIIMAYGMLNYMHKFKEKRNVRF